MMKVISFSYIFIIYNLIKKCWNYIVYPLKIYDELSKIENMLSFNSTYTIIEMGRPPQKVNFYFSLDHNKMNMTDIGCRPYNLFDIEYSQTLGIVGFPDEDEGAYSSKVYAVDYLSFYEKVNTTNLTLIEKYYLYYTADLNKDRNYLCGNIGLSLIKHEAYDSQHDEIEYYLKYYRSQNNYFSFFNYNNKDYFVNKIFLNEEFKDIFKDVKNISWINPIITDNSQRWDIYMNEIFYNNIYLKKRIIVELNPLFELIIGTNEYKSNIMNDFFNFYIEQKICLMNEIKEYHIFECDEKKFEKKDINNFPVLYLLNNNINHIFEITGEDLFIKLNNKFYFKIVFPIKRNDNKWILGRIFLRKYPVIFSPLNRLVGFYINPNKGIIIERDKETEEIKDKLINNKKEYFPKIIYLYIFIGIIFSLFGIFIGKKLFMNRKKKLNELVDDYYQYDSENEKGIKKDDKIENISIEMKCK
jgi:hypothetical protein